MSNAKHTPGPWYVERGDSCVFIRKAGRRIAATDTKTFYEKHDETDVANANLMAASPDLLAVLKDVIRSNRKDFHWGPPGEEKYRQAYAAEFALIARAEGR